MEGLLSTNIFTALRVRTQGSRTREKLAGWTALIVMILSASTFNGFAKSLSSSLSPMTLVFVSEILILFFLSMCYGLLPMFRQFRALRPNQAMPVLLIGALNGVAAPILWFEGLSRTTAVNATLLGHVEVLLTVLLAVTLLSEKFTRAHQASIVAIFVGLVIIGLKGFTEPLTFQSGDLLIVLASLCFGSGGVLFRLFLTKVPVELVVLSRSSVAIVTFILLSPFMQNPLIMEISMFPSALVIALVGFAFISRFLNLMSFYVAIDHLPVSTVSMFATLTIIGSLAFAHFYLGEGVEWYHVLGGACIIAGTLILEVVGAPSAHKSHQHLRRKVHHRP